MKIARVEIELYLRSAVSAVMPSYDWLRLAPIGSGVVVTCPQLYHNFSGIVSPFLVNRFRFFFREMKAKISISHTITRTCKSDKKCRQPEAKLDVENLKTAAVVVTRRQLYHNFSGIVAPFLVNRFPFFFHEIKAKISIYHTITKTCKSDKKYGQPEANLDVENLKTAAVVVTRRQPYHNFSGIVSPFLVDRFSHSLHKIKANISIFHTIKRTCKSDKKCTRPYAKLDVENLKIGKVTRCQPYNYLLGIFELFLGSVYCQCLLLLIRNLITFSCFILRFF